ncbi:MAG: transporter, family, partial [Microbacteriaceae bacterium]|nr:transporter, family [Microbacteriaceae bacterium]
MTEASGIGRRSVLAWAAWDWGGAAFNAVITTFVFTVYLTSDLFVDPALRPGSEAFRSAKDGLSSQLGLWLALAGVVVAVLAPVLGQRSDATGRRRLGLAIGTGVVVAATLAMFLVVPPRSFLLGVLLVAAGTVAYEIATVNYNAMLLIISTPRTIGRISAFGWASGYLGGIVLLLILYATLIPQGPQLLGVPQAGGLGIRLTAVICAIWTAVFALPVLLTVSEPAPAADLPRRGLLASYRKLFADIAGLWRNDRNLLGFLLASAVFRDGLTGVFTFGAVIAATVFGFSFGQVLIFGVAANVVAGVSTLL